ncbi:MAG: hypothetical protein QXQ87_06855 [Halobacteria archaeon]
MGFLGFLSRREKWKWSVENAISSLQQRLEAAASHAAKAATLAEEAGRTSTENQASIRSLAAQLSQLAQEVSQMKDLRHIAPVPAPAPRAPQTPLDALTPTEKRFLHILAALLKERPVKEAAHEEIARELYPAAPPARVRSTVSDYLRRLEGRGLVRRSHRGNRAYVEFTEQGLASIERAGALEIRKALSTS